MIHFFKGRISDQKLIFLIIFHFNQFIYLNLKENYLI